MIGVIELVHRPDKHPIVADITVVTGVLLHGLGVGVDRVAIESKADAGAGWTGDSAHTSCHTAFGESVWESRPHDGLPMLRGGDREGAWKIGALEVDEKGGGRLGLSLGIRL